MRQIEFLCTGTSTVFGSFQTGDRLRCGDAEARHFVDDVRCAKYVGDAPPAAPPAAAPAKTPAKKVARKAAP